eukprot:GHVQ01033160.1.p1 GENE.GHVQ01033160.1~~GHVQ01033160.1.p1  ORF type:complete len:1138 (+),score=117.81 GHVQ01033160.1:228-3641(+)
MQTVRQRIAFRIAVYEILKLLSIFPWQRFVSATSSTQAAESSSLVGPFVGLVPNSVTSGNVLTGAPFRVWTGGVHGVTGRLHMDACLWSHNKDVRLGQDISLDSHRSRSVQPECVQKQDHNPNHNVTEVSGHKDLSVILTAVTTTISNGGPSICGISSLLHNTNFPVVIAGDLKGPTPDLLGKFLCGKQTAATYRKPSSQDKSLGDVVSSGKDDKYENSLYFLECLSRLNLLDIKQQNYDWTELGAISPSNHFSRKNFGYLQAIRTMQLKYSVNSLVRKGAIWDLDDDNMIEDYTAFSTVLQETLEFNNLYASHVLHEKSERRQNTFLTLSTSKDHVLNPYVLMDPHFLNPQESHFLLSGKRYSPTITASTPPTTNAFLHPLLRFVWPRGFPLSSLSDYVTPQFADLLPPSAAVEQSGNANIRSGVGGRRCSNGSSSDVLLCAPWHLSAIQSTSDIAPDVDGLYRLLTESRPLLFTPSSFPNLSSISDVVYATTAYSVQRQQDLSAKNHTQEHNVRSESKKKRGEFQSQEHGKQEESCSSHQPSSAYQAASCLRQFTIHPSSFIPINSQSTLFLYNAFWSLYLPVTVHSRVCDIWRGYIAQALLRYTNGLVAVRTPLVSHRRNPHSSMADFQAEHSLYTQTPVLVETLKSFLCKLPSSINADQTLPRRRFKADVHVTVDTCMEQLYIYIYERGFVEEADILGVKAWLASLRKIGYKFPPVVLDFFEQPSDDAYSENPGEEQNQSAKPTAATELLMASQCALIDKKLSNLPSLTDDDHGRRNENLYEIPGSQVQRFRQPCHTTQTDSKVNNTSSVLDPRHGREAEWYPRRPFIPVVSPRPPYVCTACVALVHIQVPSPTPNRSGGFFSILRAVNMWLAMYQYLFHSIHFYVPQDPSLSSSASTSLPGYVFLHARSPPLLHTPFRSLAQGLRQVVFDTAWHSDSDPFKNPRPIENQNISSLCYVLLTDSININPEQSLSKFHTIPNLDSIPSLCSPSLNGRAMPIPIRPHAPEDSADTVHYAKTVALLETHNDTNNPLVADELESPTQNIVADGSGQEGHFYHASGDSGTDYEHIEPGVVQQHVRKSSSSMIVALDHSFTCSASAFTHSKRCLRHGWAVPGDIVAPFIQALDSLDRTAL